LAEEKLTPELKEVFSYLKAKPCVYVSAREVAETLKISYSAAYYRLRRLVDLGLIVEHVSWIVRPRIRRRWFHYIPPPLYTLKIEVNDPKMGTTEPPPGTYTYPKDTHVTVQALPNPGYKFSHWTLDGETRTENPITVVMDKDHTLKAFFVAPFYKSHCIVSVDYFEEHIFEVHIIFPHLKEEITRDDEKLLATLAFELLSDYGVPETFLLHHGTSFNLGEVQTKPVLKFNEQTEASIFDVKTTGSPVRRSYRITWKHEKAWTEVTLTGEKIEHPEKISYVKIEEIGTIGREELKEIWREKAEKEAIQ
jgi:DNA-binding Lrp family transcriptional regulator